MIEINDTARFENFVKAFNAIRTHGIVIVAAETLEVKFANEWATHRLRGTVEDYPTLDEITDIDRGQLQQDIAEKGKYVLETEVRFFKRPIPLRLTFTQLTRNIDNLLLLEFADITKEKRTAHVLDTYARELEQQNADLRRERDRSEKLLLNIMPSTIYEEWKQHGLAMPVKNDASVLMMDFVGFSQISMQRDPAEMIGDMNDIFAAFDKISEHFGCERIKTLGDSYIAVSGLPVAQINHQSNIARAACSFIHYIKRRNAEAEHKWNLRIGLASGPIIGSIVGIQKFVFDVFGMPVNLASRLESISDENTITVPLDFAKALSGDFQWSNERVETVKGIGDVEVVTLHPQAAE
jgi:adenylate cyclase